MQPFDQKDQRIKQLENENQKLQEQVKRLEHNVEALTQAILHASKQQFGASSEKTPPTEWQSSLFGEEDADNLPLPYARVIHIKEHQRPVRKKGDREKLTQGLARGAQFFTGTEKEKLSLPAYPSTGNLRIASRWVSEPTKTNSFSDTFASTYTPVKI